MKRTARGNSLLVQVSHYITCARTINLTRYWRRIYYRWAMESVPGAIFSSPSGEVGRGSEA